MADQMLRFIFKHSNANNVGGRVSISAKAAELLPVGKLQRSLLSKTSTNKNDTIASSPKEPWLAYIDDEIADNEENSYQIDVHEIVKELLLSTNDTAAADAAGQVDHFYWKTYLPSDPLMRFQDDKGMDGFLSTLYQLVFDMARFIPYNNHKQTILVRLILELRKLPPKHFKIWNEDAMVYTREPVFTVIMDDNWNGTHASDDPDSAALKQDCEEWVNFSAFIARCISSGLHDRYAEGSCRFPGVDIPEGLEEELQPGPLRDCRVLVAAQYILLAGERLYEEFVEKPVKGSKKDQWGQEKWPLWTSKFEELFKEYENEGKSEMVAATKQVYDKMLALTQETL